MLHPLETQKTPYISEVFEGENGVFIAVSDYIKMGSGSISKWMSNNFTALGTDGYGLSESREAMRDYFEISPKYIALAALTNLLKANKIDKQVVINFLDTYEIDSEKMNPAKE